MQRTTLILALAALGACEKAPPPPAQAPAAGTTTGDTSGAQRSPAVAARLLTPDPAKLDAAGPDSFTVRFSTSRGDFDVIVHRAWAPRGADRLHYLAANGFYDGVRFYRVIDGFMAQFGAHGNPAVARTWESLRIADDPVRQSNTRGVVTYATSGADSRTTQLFINFGNNAQLDGIGFAPVGRVAKGMSVVDALFNGYGEAAPEGNGPIQARIAGEGNTYLQREFPKLDSIVTARVTKEWRGP